VADNRLVLALPLFRRLRRANPSDLDAVAIDSEAQQVGEPSELFTRSGWGAVI
jgi:hypothetical protein